MLAIFVDSAPEGLTFEILVIDDGSTDDSPVIVARLAKASRGRLQLLTQDHQGPGAARNLGARPRPGENPSLY